MGKLMSILYLLSSHWIETSLRAAPNGVLQCLLKMKEAMDWLAMPMSKLLWETLTTTFPSSLKVFILEMLQKMEPLVWNFVLLHFSLPIFVWGKKKRFQCGINIKMVSSSLFVIQVLKEFRYHFCRKPTFQRFRL